MDDIEISYDTLYLKMRNDYYKDEILIESGTGKKKKYTKKIVDMIKPVP